MWIDIKIKFLKFGKNLQAPRLLVTHTKTWQSRQLHIRRPWPHRELTVGRLGKQRNNMARKYRHKHHVKMTEKEEEDRVRGRIQWYDNLKENEGKMKCLTRACSMSRQKRIAFPTSLKLWNTSVFSSAYSMISLSWWWKNSKIPGMAKKEKIQPWHLAKSTVLLKQNLWLNHRFDATVKRAAKQLPWWATFGPSIRPLAQRTGGCAASKITGSQPGTEHQ